MHNISAAFIALSLGAVGWRLAPRFGNQYEFVMLGLYRKVGRTPGFPPAVLGVMLSVAIILLFLVDLQVRYLDRITAARIDAQSFAKILAERAGPGILHRAISGISA